MSQWSIVGDTPTIKIVSGINVTVPAQTGAQIKALYEAEADTNAFDDAAVSKLAGIEGGATADQSNAEIETAYNAQVATASQAEMEAGTETAVRRMSPARIKQAIDALGGGGGGLFSGFAIIQDVKAVTTEGGTFTAGAWRDRDLNTIKSDLNGIVVSLAANKVKLPAGTYYVRAEAPAFEVLRHKAKIYDHTAGADVEVGRSHYANREFTQDWAVVDAVVTLSTESDIGVRHRCQQTGTSTGFGVASDFESEIYTTLYIWKFA